MTTRFLLPSSGTAPVTVAYGSVWEDTTNAYRAPLILSTSATAQTNITSTSTPRPAGTTPHVLRAQLVSENQLAAQTISGSFTMAIRAAENNGSANAFMYLNMYVTNAAGTTIRGTIFNSSTGTEFPGNFASSALVRTASPSTLTSLAVNNGDRLVIEIGTWFNGSAGAYNSWIYLGDQYNRINEYLPATNNSGTTGANPWIQLSQDIAFYTPPIGDTVTRDWNGNLVAIKRWSDA